MRSRYKSWQNKNHSWTRRIIWLMDDKSIHLKLEEADYGIHHIFLKRDKDDFEVAQFYFEQFKKGLTIPEFKEMSNE